MPLPISQVINGRYRVVRLLGQGGYGAVYQVWDLRLERHEALKENLTLSPEAERQFKREAILLSRLAHPNLPRVIDHFILPEIGQYLVMDYIAGEDLLHMLEESGRPLDEAGVLDWAAQVSSALEYLHAQTPPIIHRDVKPANIRITPQGQAILVDFGIAKVYEPGAATTSGARAVSMGFSPLEQYGRGGRTDVRTDVYALAATLYYALSGHMPTDALDRSLGEPLPDLLAINPAVSPQVAAAVMAAMAVYPDQRTPTVGDFRKALTGQAAIAQPPKRAVFQPAVVPQRVSRPPGRPGSEPPGSRAAPDPDPEVAGPHRPSSFPWLYAVLVASVLAVFAGVLWAGMQGLGARQMAAIAPSTLAATGGAGSAVAVIVDPGAAGGSPSAMAATSILQPTRTAGLPAVAPTRTLHPTEPPAPTRTPLPPPPTETVPQRPGRITQILFCDRPCDQNGAVQTQRFPERTTEIYFAFRFENMQPGTRYVRTWANQDAGQEWVRYDCTWQGPTDGVYYGRLWDVDGLRSGTWIVSIEIDGQNPFKEVLFIEGSYDLWTPAGVRPCTDW